MRTRRPSPEHQEAVSRRLALLSEHLAAARQDAVAVGDEWWDEHTRIAPARAPLHVVPQVDDPADDLADVPADGEAAGKATAPAVTSPPRPWAPATPVRVPVPGRHADRRAIGWGALLPDTLRGRAGLGPGPVAVVAVLVAVGLAAVCWQVLRDDPAPPVAATTPASSGALVPVGGVPTTPAAAPSAPATAASTGTVTVDVAGRVRRPGIVVLDAGARVVDALERAGGARPSVDLATLNLARPLVDGEQILVGVPGAAAAPPTGSGGVVPPAGGTAPTALVDLNLADQALLETLPDVGPVTAQAIIAWRDQHGGFTAVAELLEVDGIGDATLATLTPLVTV
jgi:competence protein ComEA